MTSARNRRLVVGAVAVIAVIALALWWLRPFGNDDVVEAIDVQAAVDQACDTLNTNHYDAVLTATTSEGSVRLEYRNAPDDSHFVSTLSDLNGVVFGKIEYILKDDILYIRDTQVGDPSTFNEWTNAGTFEGGGEPLPCFPAESVASGEVTGESGQNGERKFTRTYPGPDGSTLTKHFWVNAEGLPLRGQDHLGPSGASGQSGSDSPVVAQITYSGFGEENVITVPELAGS